MDRKQLLLELIVRLYGATRTAEKIAALAQGPIEQGDWQRTIETLRQELTYARNELTSFGEPEFLAA